MYDCVLFIRAVAYSDKCGKETWIRELYTACVLQELQSVNWFTWEKDGKEIPKIHPAQKPVAVLKKLIEIFTDPGDVVIDPCCGSGATLRAAYELGRSAYGFEIDRNFYGKAKNEMLVFENDEQMSIADFPEVMP